MLLQNSNSKQILRKRESLTLLPKFERMTHKILVTGFCMQFGDFRRLLSHNILEVLKGQQIKLIHAVDFEMSFWYLQLSQKANEKIRLYYYGT